MSSETSVIRTVTVNAPREHVFEVFTRRFDTWWPRTHKIGKAELASAVLEPREGGRWYERGVDGSECDWGSVLAYAPPSRIALSWHLNGSFQYDADPARASRVEVSFHADGPARTRVELVHSGLDRHGEGWQKLRDSVGSGWSGILGGFAQRAEAAGS
ncbi:MAG TPA: SRPBCC family protein [Polyangiaceae bacterium]|nr:SRPBCC family protein [Polyangiaceae bacterium]